ncbi:MAG: host-nuclease inhibitor Gam family protein [Patescibacteria group bacterium]|nr:host-nuclease inhibitor Gam family protein [Patescibacteria group bacterium]
MGRPKKATKDLASVEQCEAAMYRLLLATLELEKLVADRDEHVARVQRSYESDINPLTDEVADLTAQLQQYYVLHLDKIEQAGKKSLQLQYGVMGRRLSPKKLQLLNKSWTWSAVLVKLREIFGDRFIRTFDPEVDKEKIKSEMEAEYFRQCGLKLHQDENFYVEVARPKSPEVAAQA